MQNCEVKKNHMQKLSLFFFSILLPFINSASESPKKFSTGEIRMLLLAEAMGGLKQNENEQTSEMFTECAQETDSLSCAEFKAFLIATMKKNQEGLIDSRARDALKYPVESSTSRIRSWTAKRAGFEERFKEHAFLLDVTDQEYPEKFKQCFGENDTSACYFIAQLMKDKVAQHYEPVADGIIEILKKK